MIQIENRQDYVDLPLCELEQLVQDRPTQLLLECLYRYGYKMLKINRHRDFKELAIEYIQHYPCELRQGIFKQDLEIMLADLEAKKIIEYYQMESFLYRLMTETILNKDIKNTFRLRLPIYLMKTQIECLKQNSIEELTVYRGIQVTEEKLQDFLDCYKDNLTRRLYFLNFQSCSSNQTTAISFMRKNLTDKKQILFKIQANRKFIGDNTLANPLESEWILESLIQFKITKVIMPNEGQSLDKVASNIENQDYHIFEVVVEDYEREDEKYKALIDDGLNSDVNYFFKILAYFEVKMDDMIRLKSKYIMQDLKIEFNVCMHVCQYYYNHEYIDEFKKLCQTLIPRKNEMEQQHQYNLFTFLGIIELRNGRLEEALEYYKNAKTAAIRLQDEHKICIMWHYIGTALTQFNENEKGYKALNKCYIIMQKLKKTSKYKDKADLTGISNNLGLCLMQKGELVRAKQFLTYSLKNWSVRVGEQSATTALVKLRLAQCYLHMGDYKNCEKLFREGFKIIEPQKNTQQESFIRCNYIQSLLLKRQGIINFDRVQEHMRVALEVIQYNGRYNKLKDLIMAEYQGTAMYKTLNYGIYIAKRSMLGYESNQSDSEEDTYSKSDIHYTPRRQIFQQQDLNALKEDDSYLNNEDLIIEEEF